MIRCGRCRGVEKAGYAAGLSLGKGAAIEVVWRRICVEEDMSRGEASASTRL
jgi:hypothetical protein